MTQVTMDAATLERVLHLIGQHSASAARSHVEAVNALREARGAQPYADATHMPPRDRGHSGQVLDAFRTAVENAS